MHRHDQSPIKFIGRTHRVDPRPEVLAPCLAEKMGNDRVLLHATHPPIEITI